MCVGDRVVWLSDDGPEYGFVRWVGHNPDSKDDYIAGVEFVSWNKIRSPVSDQDNTPYIPFQDNPVGQGDGQFQGRRLFKATKPDHASLVPLEGLLRAEDFDNSAGWTQSTSSTKNSRNFQVEII